MNDHNDLPAPEPREDLSPEPLAGGAELDTLLRSWHDQNRDLAAQGRDRLLQALARERAGHAAQDPQRHAAETREPSGPIPFPHRRRRAGGNGGAGGGWSFGRFAVFAAALIALALIVPQLVPSNTPRGGLFERAAMASNVVMAPDGGLLEARDERGDPLGPCVLKHTDVDASISGRFARVTVVQRYHNPHQRKIEAVYTFPLPHDAAVDRMNMTVGNRVIIGQVRERDEAREMYEAAREQGRIASLLEQERPNIFTQSIANIEPGAEILIEISYVQNIEQRESSDDPAGSTGSGEFTFAFPTVVSPRYIPIELAQSGTRDVRTPRRDLDDPSLRSRQGLVLLAPAEISQLRPVDGSGYAFTPTAGDLALMLRDAIPIEDPEAWSGSGSHSGDSSGASATTPAPPLRPAAHEWFGCEVSYANGTREPVRVRSDGTGTVNGRWFYSPTLAREFDPAKPHGPAGQSAPDISSTSGAAAPGAPFAEPTPAVPDAHRITPMPVRPPMRAGHEVSIRVHLDTGGPGIMGLSAGPHPIVRSDLRSRDDGLASETTITLASGAGSGAGSMIPNSDFVLKWEQTGDTVQEAVFTHAGDHGNFVGILLQPPARPGLIDETLVVPRELVFVVDTSGSMRGQPLAAAKDVMRRMLDTMRPRDRFNIITFAGSTSVLWDRAQPATPQNRAEAMGWLDGKQGGGGTEMMQAIEAALRPDPFDDDTPGSAPVRPLRLAVFLTDGEVGNDMAIIDAVRRHRENTRVFSFGIGNSINRYLLAGIAYAGGGESEFVQLQGDGSGVSGSDLHSVVERFASRATTPLLAGIHVEASANLNLFDFVPALEAIPDVFDHSPVMLLCRYPDIAEPVSGEVTITGRTGQGTWTKRIPVTLAPARSPGAGEGRAGAEGHDVLATLWARRRIEALMNSDLTSAQRGSIDPDIRARIVQLGTTFSIMSQYTSFVAIDALRVTVDGQPMLVHVPVELPAQTDWENYFGIDASSLDALSNTASDDEAGGAWAPPGDSAGGLADDFAPAASFGAADSSVRPSALPTAASAGAPEAAPGTPAGQAKEERQATNERIAEKKQDQAKSKDAHAPATESEQLKQGRDSSRTSSRSAPAGGGPASATPASPSKSRAPTTDAALPNYPSAKPTGGHSPPVSGGSGGAAPLPSPTAMPSSSSPPPPSSPPLGESLGRNSVTATQAGSGSSDGAIRSRSERGATPTQRGAGGSQVGQNRGRELGKVAAGTEITMYKLQEPGGRSDGERRAGRAFFDAESSGVDAYGATDLPEVLPSRLTAAAEVLRSAHAARRSGQWPVIDDAQAVIAVSRRQQAADADQQHDKLVFQQAQEVTQQPIVQRFNRAALDQRKRVAATDVQSAGDGPIDKSASPATPHPQQSLPLPVPEELDDIERQARAEFDRYARLANKLDPTLLACLDPGWIAQNRARLNDAGTHATALSTRRGTTSNSADPTLDHALPLPAAQVSDDPAIVAVRLSKCTPGVIDSLRAAGLEVLSTSPADSIVIGRLALLDVERVAELEEVLFVQRAQLQAAPPQRRPASQDGE